MRKQALQLARHLIEQGRSDFICYALECVGEDWPKLYSTCLGLKSEITEALAHRDTLSGYINYLYDDNILLRDSQLARLARLAWIDKLLEEA